MLVLISVLIVGFLSSVSTELQSSKSYASGASARLLADSAVNVVITQIQEATSRPQLAWAAQPGMIRTYDTAGNADTAYKLYSSDLMKVAGAFNPLQALATEAPEAWNTGSNLGSYVDLNEPVRLGTEMHYPILHADALDGTIQGLYSSRGVEMPVRWLYVLKDGTMAAMLNNTIVGASATNPIVGRLAFWADDETSKINVNTASEGTYWARPWADSTDWVAGSGGGAERKLSKTIPAQDEFQAYPGHPATTSLSAVLNLNRLATGTALTAGLAASSELEEMVPLPSTHQFTGEDGESPYLSSTYIAHAGPSGEALPAMDEVLVGEQGGDIQLPDASAQASANSGDIAASEHTAECGTGGGATITLSDAVPPAPPAVPEPVDAPAAVV